MRLRRDLKKEREKPPRVVCIPFFHKFSHNLLAFALRFRVRVVFTSDFMFNKLMPFAGGARGCQKRHREAAVDCHVGVVYDIPMACGFTYVEQTKGASMRDCLYP